jgi:hypothetical protein
MCFVLVVVLESATWSVAPSGIAPTYRVGDLKEILGFDLKAGCPSEMLVEFQTEWVDTEALLYCDHQFDRPFLISLS